MDIEDPYLELGLSPGCSDAQVKAAWRRLAAQWHPDRNASPQATRRIQRINRAVEAIRAQRRSAPEATAPAPSEAAEEPLAAAVELSLEEAAAGCVREVRGESQASCAACGGLGRAEQPTTCEVCSGSGRVRPHLWFAWMSPSAPCEACEGTGQVTTACAPCSGSGRGPAQAWRTRLQVPAGVRDGHVLHARVKLPAGTRPLDVTLRLAPHAFFALEPDGTIRVEVPVDGFAWMAQRWVEVPTPYGPQQMRLQRGALAYRLRGHGFPADVNGARADCLVSVVPLFPQDWSPAQDKLIDRLVAGNTGHPGSEAGARMRQWKERLAAWTASRPDNASR